MPRHTRLKRRGSVYYFRAKVPADLLAHYAPKKEITFSLRTSDPKAAARLVRLESVKLDQAFAQIRQQASAKPVTEIDSETMERLAALWLSSLLEEDEEDRAEGLSERDFSKRQETLEICDIGGRHDLARGNTRLIEFEMEDFVASHGFRITRDNPSYRKLAYAFLKASAKATEAMQARHRGEVVDTPPAPTLTRLQAVTVAPSGEITLSGALEKWSAERKPPKKTLQEWTLTVKRFRDLHGDLPLSAITKRHVVQLKDALVEQGKASGTIGKQLGALSTVLEWACNNDLIAINPAKGVKVAMEKVSKEKRLPYDSTDLKRIFQAPIFTTGERPRGGAGEAAYWLPLLGLYTGARLEELGQLHVTDVKEADGVSYLEISDRGDNQRVKTESSRRRVPVHPELIRCGFMAFVQMRRKVDREGFLFHELKPDQFEKRTGNWSKWWGRYMRQQVGIQDSRKVFHSFRHGFKDACRACGIEEAIHDALTGHSGGGVGRSYGGLSYPLQPLAQALEKVRYGGLDLKHLCKE